MKKSLNKQFIMKKVLMNKETSFHSALKARTGHIRLKTSASEVSSR